MGVLSCVFVYTSRTHMYKYEKKVHSRSFLFLIPLSAFTLWENSGRIARNSVPREREKEREADIWYRYLDIELKRQRYQVCAQITSIQFAISSVGTVCCRWARSSSFRWRHRQISFGSCARVVAFVRVVGTPLYVKRRLVEEKLEEGWLWMRLWRRRGCALSEMWLTPRPLFLGRLASLPLALLPQSIWTPTT